ncbi:MAG TPA: hypothetical protein VIN08_08125 [Ohtaekwangia sp.]|uniref:hypothetical protein n=1 Tax=Ohtaekwangia sp. TaxID=2066019 RepID=UPI002F92B795
MKRFIAISFLLVFLFNVIGYYGLFWLTREHLRANMQQQLDAGNYAEHEAVTLKIPLSLPYPLQHENQYERINGGFEHAGAFYKLVKQKLVNDTLYIVCIPDHQERKLHTAITDFVKSMNDLPATSKTLKGLGSLIKDFEIYTSGSLQSAAGWFCNNTSFKDSEYILLSGIHSIFTPPPQAVA